MKARAIQVNPMLRIGVIHQGCIVEDQLFKTKARVTAGRSLRNRLSLPAANLPERYRLVDSRRGRQHLCFRKGMRGKVFTNGEVVDLRTAAKRKLAERRGDRFYLPLGHGVRASVVVGDTTFLFQHVRAPAKQGGRILPKSARGCWWRSLDRPFLSVLAMSLFAQGGFEAVQEMYWRDTGRYLVKERSHTPKILQTLVRAEALELEAQPAVAEDTPLETQTAPTEPAEPTESATIPTAEGVPDSISEGVDPALTPADLDRAAPTATAGVGRMIDPGDLALRFSDANPVTPPSRPVKGNSGGALRPDHAIPRPSDGQVGAVLVLQSMYGEETVHGVGVARHDDPWGGEGREITASGEPGDPNLVWGPEPGLLPIPETVMPGPSAREIAEALATTLPTVQTPVISSPTERLVPDAPEATTERRIRVSVKGGRIGRALGTGKLDLAAVRDVVRKRTPGLQRTFMEAVRKNPGLGGRIEIRITVGVSGRARVEITEDRIGDPSFARALKRRIAAWRFPKPKGGEVSFRVPFRFRAI